MKLIYEARKFSQQSSNSRPSAPNVEQGIQPARSASGRLLRRLSSIQRIARAQDDAEATGDPSWEASRCIEDGLPVEQHTYSHFE